jgi:hypothetical protein
MANRSLRRNRPTTIDTDSTVRDGVGHDEGPAIEPVIGTENDAASDNGNADDSAEQSHSVGGVSYVEFDPSQYERHSVTAEPAGTDSGNGDGTRTRRRRADAGQPRGERSRKRVTASESIAPFVTMAHTWAATLLKTPELMLDEKEAKQLSDAYEHFCQHHDVPVMSAKRLSEIQLIGALGMVYGTRFMAVRERLKHERATRRNKVVQIGVNNVSQHAGD